MKGEIIRIERAEELKRSLMGEKDDEVKVKLIFLNALANCNVTYETASAMCGIHTSTGYVWVRKWNEKGYEGLKDSENKGGRPPKLSEEDLKNLEVNLKGKDYWTTKDVKKLIFDRYGVQLSEDSVVRILREKLGMRFSKPYPVDYRRPIDAEILLENQLRLVFMLLKEKGIKDEEIAIGFVDENRPQNTSNTVRVWSLEKVKIIKNSTKFKTNTIGFYAIKGESAQKFLDDSKAESIAGFFKDVKNANMNYRAIVAIIDNFASHRSSIVRDRVNQLDIYLVFLPPYSPDLNPIEFIWKSIKRVLSLNFIPNLDQMKKTISEEWITLSHSMSYARSWIERFLKKRMILANYFWLCGGL
jgi:transposase